MNSVSYALLPQSRNFTPRAPRFARLFSGLTGLRNAVKRNPALIVGLTCIAAIYAFAIIAIAAVITHVVWCIKAGAWLLLIAGIVPFVSFVHGVMIWLGHA